MIISLVTGGAGFMGSHVVDELISKGHKVIVLDDLSGGYIENVHPKAQFVQGSIVDHILVDKLFNDHKFNYVFHLAAYAAEGLSHFIKRFNYTNNLIGSINLINASVNSGTVKCFIYTSSIAVYGVNQLPMTEDLTPKPEDPYGIAKYAVEQDLHESFEMFGLRFIIFRPHNVYGERQNIGDKYRNVIGIFMNQVLQKLPLTIFGNGEQTRAFSYISDVAPVIALSYENESAYNKVFNVGADQPYSVNQLVNVISKTMGVEPNIKRIEARNEVVHAYSAHDQVKEYFGDLIKGVSLEDGVQKMAQWAIKHGYQKTKPFTGIEVLKNMPQSWVERIKPSGI